ncbi:MAG: lytic transglycosylase domain-containing protein [Bacteroidetes bacterium]|nr:lytic transglycosylase domain-containing protein [Bacteroidota bacterium]
MLKRKLWRMSFLCQGAYLVIAASNGGNLKHSPESSIGFIDSADSVIMYDSLSGPKVRLNTKVAKFAASYISENEEALKKVKERSKLIFPIMDSILTKYELPVEIKYLAVVESDLKSDALSKVGAAGPWQLMPTTARQLGLKITHNYDERKSYKKSTVAAAKYIKDLYGEFGDWLLVIAAYNGGPAPVYAAIRKSGSHNFWKLQNYLPAETRGHVKRYISTHFYFEGQGSATTLTKKEMEQYLSKVKEFNVANNIKSVAADKRQLPIIDSGEYTSSVAGKLIAER